MTVQQTGRPASPTVKYEMADLMLLLQQALAEPIGLLCRVEDPARARQRIWVARQKACNAEFDILQVRLCQIGEGNLVICKNKVLAPAPVLQSSSPAAKGHSAAVRATDKTAEELDL